MSAIGINKEGVSLWCG